MRISNFYKLGLALSVIQWGFGWWAFAHAPAGSEPKDNNTLTYRGFLRLTLTPALWSSTQWIFLIIMAHPKLANFMQKRAGVHVWGTLFFTAWRILIGVLVNIKKPSAEFSELLSSCALWGFGSFTCAPLGILLFCPVMEILISLSAAFIIRHRAIARHGTEQVEVPPPPPTFAAAWTLGDVMELDYPPATVAEGTIELKV